MICVENLSLSVSGNVLLEDVSFRVEQGEYVGLIGPNGAGKTTLLKTLLGFYVPTAGTVEIGSGVRVGYVPQKFFLSQVVPVSVKEVLCMSRVFLESELIRALEKVELDASFLSKNFHVLSGGQQQRVIIARALCETPDLLLFDEPLTGVDYGTKTKLYQLLSRLNKDEGLTIVFVSHEIDHVISDCHRVLCLNKTMHTGCHPMAFAQGKIEACPVLDTHIGIMPVHHHHSLDC